MRNIRDMRFFIRDMRIHPGYRLSTVMAAPGVRSFFIVSCESGALVSLPLCPK